MQKDLLTFVSCGSPSRRPAVGSAQLTLIDAIWQYMAGVSRLFPIVKKNRLSSANTSDKTVSTRFGSGLWELRVLGPEVEGAELGPEADGDESSRTLLSLVTGT